MKLKEKLTGFLVSASLTAAGCLPAVMMPVYAEDYSDTEYWYSQCTKPQTSSEGVKACEGFREHENQRRQQLQQSITDFSNSIGSLEGETDKVAALAQEQKALAEELSNQISQKEAVIAQIEANIQALQEQIVQKQAEIDAWDAQIKSRMRHEQGNVGTNMLVDLVMGASDLNDMLRRISGIERITEDDQTQISRLNEMKAELELSVSEEKRLQEENTAQKAELEEQKAEAQRLEDSYNQLVAQYQQQIAELQAQKRAAEADMNAIRDFVITSAAAGSASITTSSGFNVPVLGGQYSAGTWAYPGGGLHLGLDWAAPIGTPVVAPANGIVLYAANPVASNSGYLGNMSGYPYGSGNSICLLCSMNGSLYAFSFFHLSQEGMAVRAGQSVSAGQQIALTGNSGNSTGPHCHIEVINLGNMSVEDAIKRFSSSADFAWGTGWGNTAGACEAKGSTPCRERPEVFFS